MSRGAERNGQPSTTLLQPVHPHGADTQLIAVDTSTHPEVPHVVVIYEIGADYILGKTRDELRVEYAQLWRLDR